MSWVYFVAGVIIGAISMGVISWIIKVFRAHKRWLEYGKSPNMMMCPYCGEVTEKNHVRCDKCWKELYVKNY